MIFDFLFPNRCLDCNKIIPKDEVICETCESKLHFTHYDFACNNSLLERAQLLFPVENAFALLHYQKDSLAQKIIHQLKYNHREKIGLSLAKWTTERLNFSQEKPDLMVTVPLHKKKQKQRGYNQLHLFANLLSSYYNIPVDHQLLQRTKHSRAQAKKNLQERLKTKNAYHITSDVNGKHLLLIDDVYTTGNTLSNIAWEIITRNQNVKISILLMAIDF